MNKIKTSGGCFLIICVVSALWGTGCAKKDSEKMAAAVWRGDLDTVKLMQKRKVDISHAPVCTLPDPPYTCYTPLSVSLKSGFKDMTDYLLNQGVDVNATNSDGSTALWFLGGDDYHVELANRLLSMGANPNVKARDGTTPLIEARLAHSVRVVQLLLSKGAADPFAEAIVQLPHMERSTDGTMRLLYGVVRGSEETNMLIMAIGNNDLKSVSQLVANGADVNRVYGRINLSGVTPLTVAVIRNTADIVSYLLNHGADVNARNYDGSTALMQAVANQEVTLDVVKLLVARGADVTLKDKVGSGALDYATLSHNDDALTFIRNTINQ